MNTSKPGTERTILCIPGFELKPITHRSPATGTEPMEKAFQGTKNGGLTKIKIPHGTIKRASISMGSVSIDIPSTFILVYRDCPIVPSLTKPILDHNLTRAIGVHPLAYENRD